jgi:hypothetical protein
MKQLIYLMLFTCIYNTASGQQLTSIIRGTIVDKFNKIPLVGANVVFLDSLKQSGTITDSIGNFVFNSVSIGRHTIAISFIGYKSFSVNNFIVASGKETFLTIELEEEAVQLDKVTISSNPKRTTKSNLAYISGRTFNVEETERYAGTNGDPARMASYFAGVMSTGDTRNDIIIRGNSPIGLLWRLEGVDIPNPNHFAASGTTGGPICILNNNQLTNSDFFTGAFPAQYGNALSGVFDLKLRNGNNQKRENTFQMGTNGIELGFEGYFTKKSSASYMVNYRYAFLELFDVLGIQLDIPTIPKYQDLSFKLNFPTKKGSYSIWGLGGKSNMEMFADKNDISSTRNMNVFFGSDMGAVGLTHSYLINDKSYVKTSIALTGAQSYMRVDSVITGIKPYTFFGSNFNEVHSIFTSLYKLKINQKLRFVSGITYTHLFINYIDTAKLENRFLTITENSGDYGLLESHIQGEYNINEKIKFTSGLHFQYMLLNNTYAIEPRAAFNYELNHKTDFQLGYGLHSQAQQSNVYFNKTLIDTLNSKYIETNRNLNFTKSHHFVAGMSHLFNPTLKLNIEIYYQHLFDIPIQNTTSAYSAINNGTDFYSIIEDSLKNGGIAKNKGIEFSLERFYKKGYYYVTTLSFFDSKYRGSDNKWYNTLFNNNYVINILGGYEFKLPKNRFLSVNSNIAWAGGLRYIPINIEKSIEAQETVYEYEKSFEEKYKDFFKMNIKFIYRVNGNKYSYESGFGINNLTNRKNIMQQTFNTETGKIVYDYQMGLMPEGFFRIYF